MAKTPLTSYLYDNIVQAVNQSDSNKVGRLLTLIEAVIPDKDQQKAVKDMLRQVFFDNDVYNSVKTLCSIAYDELRSQAPSDSADKKPYWYTKRDDVPMPMSWGVEIDTTK